MLAQETSYFQSLIRIAEGKIQSKVSKFLALKEPLNKMTYHPSPDISNRAKQLYSNQVSLEADLQKGLALINDMKTTGFEVGKSVEVASIAAAMDTHIKAAQAFLGQAPPVIVSATKPAWFVPTTGFQWGLSIAIVAMGLWIFQGIVFGKK